MKTDAEFTAYLYSEIDSMAFQAYSERSLLSVFLSMLTLGDT